MPPHIIRPAFLLAWIVTLGTCFVAFLEMNELTDLPAARIPACDRLAARAGLLAASVDDPDQFQQWQQEVLALSSRRGGCAADERVARSFLHAHFRMDRLDDAALLIEQDRMQGWLTPELATAQQIEIDLQRARSLGDASSGDAFRDAAGSAAHDLLLRWPQWWSVLSSFEQALPGVDPPPAPSLLEEVRRWFRHPVGFPWILALLLMVPGMVLLSLGLILLANWIQFRRPTVRIVQAGVGDEVTLEGQLSLPAGRAMLKHPVSGIPCIWYAGRPRNGLRRSLVPVVLKDGSGSVFIFLSEAAQVWTAPGPDWLVEGDRVFVRGRIAEPDAQSGSFRRVVHGRFSLVRMGFGSPARKLPAVLRSAVICLALFAIIAAFCTVTFIEQTRLPEPTPWDLQAARVGPSVVPPPIE